MTRNITLRAGVYAKSATPSTGNIQVVSQLPTVTITANNPQYPNQPAGAIPLLGGNPVVFDMNVLAATTPETDAQPFSALNKTGSSSWSTVTDATAPRNPTKVGRLLMDKDYWKLYESPTPGYEFEPSGTTKGKMTSSTKLRPPAGAKKLYTSFYFKMTTIGGLPAEVDIFGLKMINYGVTQWTGSVVLQLWNDSFGSGSSGAVWTTDQKNGPWYLGWYLNGLGQFDSTNHAAGPLVDDTWYHVEVVLDMSTATGSIYVDGTWKKTTVFSTLNSAVTTLGNITQFEFSRVWGGGRLYYYGVPSFNPWYMDHDELYMSYTV